MFQKLISYGGKNQHRLYGPTVLTFSSWCEESRADPAYSSHWIGLFSTQSILLSELNREGLEACVGYHFECCSNTILLTTLLFDNCITQKGSRHHTVKTLSSKLDHAITPPWYCRTPHLVELRRGGKVKKNASVFHLDGEREQLHVVVIHVVQAVAADNTFKGVKGGGHTIEDNRSRQGVQRTLLVTSFRWSLAMQQFTVWTEGSPGPAQIYDLFLFDKTPSTPKQPYHHTQRKRTRE